MSAASQRAAQTQRRMRGLLIAFLAWLALAVILIAWWGRLILIQATHIEELERQLGVAEAAERWARTARMLYWESAAFITFFAVSTALLLWLYWRDTRRVKSLQAFFASMTHELRTPLTSIRLQAESIAESLPARTGDAGASPARRHHAPRSLRSIARWSWRAWKAADGCSLSR